ncbi:DUF2946 family protein [Thalassovita aquimarina]|uniref:DUF2946 domain-containing protein n=1 Tax=Thalassovita aquimarina TaxID=2785917 RepID=A0ABS5HQS3_9RHOB|nr:DUF2946 family protein [Thalassovita aquimarina]MBR9651290.1 hypothetical protein [Thalassovita aquimarina]
MRLVLSLLLLVAVMVRATVPDGYMVAQNAETGFEIVICTDGGMATLFVDEAGNPVESDQHDQEPGETCPFALAATALLAVEQPQPDFQPIGRNLPSWAAEDQRTRIAIVASNAARAPPFTV